MRGAERTTVALMGLAIAACTPCPGNGFCDGNVVVSCTVAGPLAEPQPVRVPCGSGEQCAMAQLQSGSAPLCAASFDGGTMPCDAGMLAVCTADAGDLFVCNVPAGLVVLGRCDAGCVRGDGGAGCG